MSSNTENEHLLENKWTLWFRPPGSHSNATPQAKVWEHSQKVLFSAATVEEFWRGFHNIPRITPSHPVNCDYSLFRDGIKPAWEDEYNNYGGRWTYNVERRANQSNMLLPSIIEQSWLDVMLCLIGEGFDPLGDKIAGGVLAVRQPPRSGKMSASESIAAKLHIWTKDASDIESNTKIGEIFKATLNAPDGTLVYSQHDQGGSGKGRNNYNQGNLRL